MNLADITVLVKGGGDLGSAAACRLYNSGIKVAVMDLPSPLGIRREVSFSTAIKRGSIRIEDIPGKLVKKPFQFSDFVPVFTSDNAEVLGSINHNVLVDATLQGVDFRTTEKTDAELTIGLGPGFIAGRNIGCVIETRRGNNLGKVIWEGGSEEYTGIPGDVEGFGAERVIRAPEAGRFKTAAELGDMVNKNDIIGWVEGREIRARINGIIRGLVEDGTHVKKDYKIGDIDSRGIKEYVFSISDKARGVSGGILEAVLSWMKRMNSSSDGK